MCFYTDPVPFPGVALASVRYSAREGRRVHPIAHDFCQYFERVAERLSHADRTRMSEVVWSALEAGLDEHTDLLHGDDYALELVSEGGDIRKRCYARFFEDRPAVLRLYGGDEYYGPLTVFAFLQLVTNALAPAERKRLTGYLRTHLEAGR